MGFIRKIYILGFGRYIATDAYFYDCRDQAICMYL